MPSTSTLHFPDLSSFQSGLDLTKVRVDAAIVKATQGDWYTNPAFATHMAQAKGGLRGAYHFWETGTTASAQVDKFLSVVGPYLDGKTLIALDYEPGYNNDLPGAAEWLALVEQRTGLCPILYLNHYYAGLGWPAEVKRCPVWLAGAPDAVYYPNAIPAGVPNLPGWQVIAQQWTDKGTLSGYSSTLDLNVWFGDEASWVAQATKATTTPTGDWFDMATVDDLKQAVREVLAEQTVGDVKWSAQHVWDYSRRKEDENGRKLDGLASLVGTVATQVGANAATVQAEVDGIKSALDGAVVVSGGTVTVTPAPATPPAA